jgi:antitoxin component of RelBE/YafQ-DinJ toxin-antitoxin module
VVRHPLLLSVVDSASPLPQGGSSIKGTTPLTRCGRRELRGDPKRLVREAGGDSAPQAQCPSMTQEPNTIQVSWLGKFRTTDATSTAVAAHSGTALFILRFRSDYWWYRLTETVTVSAKIDVRLRKQLAELGIKPSEAIRRALEKEVEEKLRAKLQTDVEAASTILSKVPEEEWVRAVRESREER